MRTILAASLVAALAGADAVAQEPQSGAPAAGAPGVIVQGAPTVSIGNMPAARRFDQTTDGQGVGEGSSNVIIGGRPAARVGDRTNCGGVIVRGSNNVFMNGKPAARTGDVTAGC